MATTPAVSNSAAELFAQLNGLGNSKSSALSDAQNRFLTLLTTQLRNQDPLSPMENAEMTSQLAQISTVDGIERLNATLQTLMSNSVDSAALQAASMVGHGVLVAGNGLTLSEGVSLGGIELAGPADIVKVVITDANGLVVRTLDLGEQDAGLLNYQWDGKADNGDAAADGRYTVKIEAVQGKDKVQAEALELGLVTSIMKSSAGVGLNLGSLGTHAVTDIKQIL